MDDSRELCAILSGHGREEAALQLAAATAVLARCPDQLRTELAEFMCARLAARSADEVYSYVLQLKEHAPGGRHAIQVLFALAKLLHAKGYQQQGFELALECLDQDEPASPAHHAHMYYHHSLHSGLTRRSSSTKRDCALWVTATAEQLHCLPKAVKALVVLAKVEPTLDNFRRVKDLALKADPRQWGACCVLFLYLSFANVCLLHVQRRHARSC